MGFGQDGPQAISSPELVSHLLLDAAIRTAGSASAPSSLSVGLVDDLTVTQDEPVLPKFLAKASKYHLFVIDELGFIPFPPVGPVFEFCATLCERVAAIVTTSLR